MPAQNVNSKLTDGNLSGNTGGVEYLVPAWAITSYAGLSEGSSAGPSSSGTSVRHTTGHSKARQSSGKRVRAAPGYSYHEAPHLPAGEEEQRF